MIDVGGFSISTTKFTVSCTTRRPWSRDGPDFVVTVVSWSGITDNATGYPRLLPVRESRSSSGRWSGLDPGSQISRNADIDYWTHPARPLHSGEQFQMSAFPHTSFAKNFFFTICETRHWRFCKPFLPFGTPFPGADDGRLTKFKELIVTLGLFCCRQFDFTTNVARFVFFFFFFCAQLRNIFVVHFVKLHFHTKPSIIPDKAMRCIIEKL